MRAPTVRQLWPCGPWATCRTGLEAGGTLQESLASNRRRAAGLLGLLLLLPEERRGCGAALKAGVGAGAGERLLRWLFGVGGCRGAGARSRLALAAPPFILQLLRGSNL